MPEVVRRGVPLHYTVTGTGAPVVLGHSFLCSGAMWAPQVPVLAERHRVINIDLRGHGRSGVVDEPFTLYDLVDDVLAVLDDLKIDCAVWAGLSIGGMVAMRAALTAGNRVSGLVLLDTLAGSETSFNRMKYKAMAAAAGLLGTGPLLPQLVRMFFSSHTRRTNPELVREWRGRFASVPRTTIRRTVDALVTRDSVLARLPDVRVPTLVVAGQCDPIAPPRISRELVDALPRGSLVVVDGAGHLPALERPETVNAAMLSFLEKQLSQGAAPAT